MKRPVPGKGTKIAAGVGAAGTVGSAGWATWAGGPVWVPVCMAITTAVLVAVQAVLNTMRDIVRDIAPQKSEHRVETTAIVLGYLTTRRRDLIKERRERAERKALALTRRPRTIVLVAGHLPRRTRVQSPLRARRQPLASQPPTSAPRATAADH
jgi:hypothetical protein